MSYRKIFDKIAKGGNSTLQIGRKTLTTKNVSLQRLLAMLVRKGFILCGIPNTCCPQSFVLTYEPLRATLDATISNKAYLDPFFVAVEALHGKRALYKLSSVVRDVFCSGCISVFDALYTGSGSFTAKTYKKMRPAAQIAVSPSDIKPHIKPLPVKSYYPDRRFRQSEIEDITVLCLHFYLYESIAHGEDHIISSVRYATALARSECPQQFNDVIVGVALHDVGRRDDSGGNAHAIGSAKLARIIINNYWPMLDIDKIADAIFHHADGRISSDKLVGAIWDADRLEQIRCGRRIDLSLLSTETAKRIARKLNALY